MANGFFVAIEGIDGSGKTTMTQYLAERFRRVYPGVGVIQTADGVGTPTAEAIQSLISNADIAVETKILLTSAARKENNDKVIVPALKRGDIVISDSWLLSTRATFCFDDKWLHRLVMHINDTCAEKNPNITLVLTCDASRAHRRRACRDNKLELLNEFPNKIDKDRDLILRQVAREQWVDYKIINANASMKKVAERVWETANKRYQKHLQEHSD